MLDTAYYQENIRQRLALSFDEMAHLLRVWPTYADRNAADPDRAVVGPRLQALYAEADVLRKRLQDLRDETDTMHGNVQEKDSQKFTHVEQQIAQVMAQANAIEGRAVGRRAGGAVAPVAATSPTTPPAGVPDAGHIGYRGSPYWRNTRRW